MVTNEQIRQGNKGDRVGNSMQENLLCWDQKQRVRERTKYRQRCSRKNTFQVHQLAVILKKIIPSH